MKKREWASTRFRACWLAPGTLVGSTQYFHPSAEKMPAESIRHHSALASHHARDHRPPQKRPAGGGIGLSSISRTAVSRLRRTGGFRRGGIIVPSFPLELPLLPSSPPRRSVRNAGAEWRDARHDTGQDVPGRFQRPAGTRLRVARVGCGQRSPAVVPHVQLEHPAPRAVLVGERGVVPAALPHQRREEPGSWG